MAARDLFAPVARPVDPAPEPQALSSFKDRWAQLVALTAERWGTEKVYWLEQKIAWLHKFRDASALASNAAFAAALDDLRHTGDCPHNIPTWMAAALERAMDAEKHKPPEHVAHEGDVSGRKARAYQRIARNGHGEV